MYDLICNVNYYACLIREAAIFVIKCNWCECSLLASVCLNRLWNLPLDHPFDANSCINLISSIFCRFLMKIMSRLFYQ